MLVIAQIQSIANNINRLLGKVKITDGTNDAEVLAHPVHGLRVGVIDSSGTQIDTFGTAWSDNNKIKVWNGTQYLPSMDDPARPGYVLPIETVPTSTEKKNPSIALTWTNGELVTIEKTIGGTTYTKTLTWTAGKLTAISAWS